MNDRQKTLTLRLCYAALCLSLALTLPRLFGAIPGGLGKNLSPMHLTSMLCGILAGAPFGAVIGFLSPLLGSLFNGAPTFFPNAVCMAAECLAYGTVAALLYGFFKNRTCGVQIALVGAMLAGRLVGGAAKYLLLAFGVIENYPFSLFLTSYFVDTLPGAVLQLALIPPIVEALKKAKLIK